MRAKILQFLTAGLTLSAFLPGAALAGPERIAGLKVKVVSNHEIRVSAELIRWMNTDLESDIQNGIPKDLFYSIALNKRLAIWFDEELQIKTIKHTIKYDVLKGQYHVTTWNDGNKREQVAHDLGQLMELISVVNNVKIDLDRGLKSRHTYYVSVKAEVKASRLPFYLDYILFFIPVLELDTPWAHSAPFYAPATAEGGEELK
jgi:hypothetical protein